MAITREQVLEAARSIAAEGSEPTYMSVRARLGTGSFSTIQKYLRDWRTSDQVEPQPVPPSLPEAFTEALNRFGAEAWRAASEWARDEVDAARLAFEDKLAEVRGEMEQAATAVDALQESLNLAEAERDRFKGEAEGLTKQLAAVEGTLGEVRRQSESKLQEERAQTDAVRRESDARDTKSQEQLRETERRGIEAETRTKELQSEVRTLREELAAERTAREKTETGAPKVTAELDQERKRVTELVAERDKEREGARSFMDKIEEWVRRATEAETKLSLQVTGPESKPPAG